MNQVMEVLMKRRSVRAEILKATLKEMLCLPQYVFPICMLVFGSPTRQQLEGVYIQRFDEKCIVFENRYRRLPAGKSMRGITTVGQATYLLKFSAGFSMEMRRSMRELLKARTK